MVQVRAHTGEKQNRTEQTPTIYSGESKNDVYDIFDRDIFDISFPSMSTEEQTLCTNNENYKRRSSGRLYSSMSFRSSLTLVREIH